MVNYKQRHFLIVELSIRFVSVLFLSVLDSGRNCEAQENAITGSDAPIEILQKLYLWLFSINFIFRTTSDIFISAIKKVSQQSLLLRSTSCFSQTISKFDLRAQFREARKTRHCVQIYWDWWILGRKQLRRQTRFLGRLPALFSIVLNFRTVRTVSNCRKPVISGLEVFERRR